MPQTEWGKASKGVAQAKELLQKYEFYPHRLPLPPIYNPELDQYIESVLSKLK